MRVLESTVGQVRIFSDRIFGYKRYYVDWGEGHITTFHGIWYNLKTIEEMDVQVSGQRHARRAQLQLLRGQTMSAWTERTEL